MSDTMVLPISQPPLKSMKPMADKKTEAEKPKEPPKTDSVTIVSEKEKLKKQFEENQKKLLDLIKQADGEFTGRIPPDPRLMQKLEDLIAEHKRLKKQLGLANPDKIDLTKSALKDFAIGWQWAQMQKNGNNQVGIKSKAIILGKKIIFRPLTPGELSQENYIKAANKKYDFYKRFADNLDADELNIVENEVNQDRLKKAKEAGW